MEYHKLKSYLDDKVDFFNTPDFIKYDPISIPHRFSKKEDIEIIGLLTATIAWGNRVSIIKNGQNLIKLLNDRPYKSVINYKEKDYHKMKLFKHRTFNGFDLHFFLLSLKNIYINHGGLENLFTIGFKDNKGADDAIGLFRNTFFEGFDENIRTKKHIANPGKGSAAKRLNMFLRWMVRKDNKGVDFGIWKDISPAQLSCPLDVHSGNSARRTGLLRRKQNDWKAVQELDSTLRKFDPDDPVKYDFALFGMGIEKL